MLSKKVLQFILLTFLISWSVAGATYLLHITYGSIPSLLIIAVCYMPAPAYATLILEAGISRFVEAIRVHVQKLVAALALDNYRRLCMVYRPVNICGNWRPWKRIRSSSLWQN